MFRSPLSAEVRTFLHDRLDVLLAESEAPKEAFQKRCQNERRRLGVGGVTSALGDGALWIWSLVFMVFGKTMECLDIYHALEHVAACGKAVLP